MVMVKSKYNTNSKSKTPDFVEVKYKGNTFTRGDLLTKDARKKAKKTYKFKGKTYYQGFSKYTR